MTRSLCTLMVVPLLLTFLPYPATPTPPAHRLSSAETDDVWDVTQDLVKLLLDTSLTPTSSNLRGSLYATDPSRLFLTTTTGDWSSGQFQPGQRPPRFDWFSAPGGSSFSRGEDFLSSGAEPVVAAPSGLFSSAKRKRGRPSLCHMIGFPMGSGCAQGGRAWAVPKTRSVQTAQRKNSPSLYLFGGAIGR